MNARRLLIAIATTLLLAVSALAQFSGDQKREILSEMDDVLIKDAFVPGVDLHKWRTFVDSRKDKLNDAETPWEFANVVNSALSEFGLSHIQLLRERFRRFGGGEETLSAAQGRRFRGAPAQLRWLEDGAACIRISTFDTAYDEAGVEDLFTQAKDARYLVLDLRGNPGGEVENMRHFLGLVASPDAPVGTFVSRRMAEAYNRANKDKSNDPVAIAKWASREFKPAKDDIEPFKGSIAVIVDGHSASAAEIVANALHEIRHSPVVGSKTMGAVLVSTFGQLSYGFKLQFPIGDYVSRDGHRLEGHPLVPDVSADTTDWSAPVDAALARLKSKPVG